MPWVNKRKTRMVQKEKQNPCVSMVLGGSPSNPGWVSCPVCGGRGYTVTYAMEQENYDEMEWEPDPTSQR